MMGKLLFTLIVFGVSISSYVFADVEYSTDISPNKTSCEPIMDDKPSHINMTCISLVDGMRSLKHFGYSKSLKTVTLIRNKLTKFPRKFCAIFPRLLTITVKQQQIQNLTSDSFLNITYKLETLILNDNGIKFIEAATFRRFKELRILQLTGNRLKIVHSDTFVGLEKLEELHLYDNRITAIGPSAFTLRNLNWLDLEKNQLQYLPPRIFFKLPKLKFLKLYGNPLASLSKALIPRHPLLILSLTFNDNVTIQSDAFCGVRTTIIRLNGDQLNSRHVGTFNGLTATKLILFGNNTNHFNIPKNLFVGCQIESIYCYVKNFELSSWIRDIQWWGFELPDHFGIKMDYDHHTYLDREGQYEPDKMHSNGTRFDTGNL